MMQLIIIQWQVYNNLIEADFIKLTMTKPYLNPAEEFRLRQFGAIL